MVIKPKKPNPMESFRKLLAFSFVGDCGFEGITWQIWAFNRSMNRIIAHHSTIDPKIWRILVMKLVLCRDSKRKIVKESRWILLGSWQKQRRHCQNLWGFNGWVILRILRLSSSKRLPMRENTMQEFLADLLLASEKAAHIARACRKEKDLFQLLIQVGDWIVVPLNLALSTLDSNTSCQLHILSLLKRAQSPTIVLKPRF